MLLKKLLMLGTLRTNKLLILGTHEIPHARHFEKKLLILGTSKKNKNS